jgi:hypothetical protein
MNSKRIVIVDNDPGVTREVAIRCETGIDSAIVQPTKEITPPTNDTTIISNRLLDTQETTFTPPVGDVPCSLPKSEAQPKVSSPSRLARLLGLVVLRACPAACNLSTCQDCHLRALCKCAQQDFEASTALEQKIWAGLTLCVVIAVLYAIYCFAVQS